MGIIHIIALAVVAFVVILLLTQWAKRRRIQRLTDPNRNHDPRTRSRRRR